MRLLLRNWHLKLAAVAVATTLYTGLVFSGSLAEFTVLVPVSGVNQPQDSFLLSGDLGFTQVRYRTSSEAGSELPADAFTAEVDLSQYDMSRAPEPQELTITVRAEGVAVVEHTPATVRVELDRIETRSVPVDIDTGEIPSGLAIDEPVSSERDGQVEVQGPATEVARVDRALARIRIDPSGIDFDQPVTLVAVDIEGQPVSAGRVELSPESISVRVDVEAVETTKTVPVTPAIGGTPAPGYALTALSVEPATVTLRGLPEVLSEVTEVLTEPLVIDDVTESQTFEAELVLPEGTRLARASAEPAVTVEASIGLSVGSRSFVVGVVCQGAGQNGCQPGLSQLTLTLSGPSGVLSALGANQLTPILNVSGLAPGTYNVEPLIPALPDGVEVLQLVPGTVQVRIVAPSTPAPSP